MVYSEKNLDFLTNYMEYIALPAFKLCQYNRPEVYGPSIRGKPEYKALNYSFNGGQIIVRYMSKSTAMRFGANCVVFTDKVYTNCM